MAIGGSYQEHFVSILIGGPFFPRAGHPGAPLPPIICAGRQRPLSRVDPRSSWRADPMNSGVLSMQISSEPLERARADVGVFCFGFIWEIPNQWVGWSILLSSGCLWEVSPF